MDFASIRKEYEQAGLSREQLNRDPLALLKQWVQVAIDQSPGAWFEANAMTLATVNSKGAVSCRVVLLKDTTDVGIKFYTNYDSRKGMELRENPSASVVFHWPYLGRQLRVCGTVEFTSREDSAHYFHSRPRGSQISAFVSRQSEIVESREHLEKLSSTADEEYADREIPLPDDWGGYHLIATEFEFWQGRRDRLHDRFRFLKSDDQWQIERLAP